MNTQNTNEYITEFSNSILEYLEESSVNKTASGIRDKIVDILVYIAKRQMANTVQKCLEKKLRLLLKIQN